MLTSRHITKLIAILMALAVLLCLGASAFSGSSRSGVTMEYESELFDTSQIISLNIIMDADDWQDMLDNAISEEYYKCDVEVNGTMFYSVGIRPKGNTSLSSIANDPTTDRYSFKLEFDHYIEGQTCFGLDKLILNNNYADATSMKEALIYDMFAYLGADASLYNYAKISVNGEYWGVYLALEGVEDSFMLRNYGAQSGELYKPEDMNVGGGGGKRDDFQPSEDFQPNGDFQPGNRPGAADNSGASTDTDSTDTQTPPEKPDENSADAQAPSGAADSISADDASGRPTPPDFGGEMPDMADMPDMSGSFGGFSMSSDGADLNYTDDDLDSYSTIWDGEITSTGKADHKRVVEALKSISEGTDLEKYMDVDNLLRYMAVHIFSVNDDSLSGSMAHNYYLYEYSGQLNIIPWDYNLAFGGMGGGDASSVINSPIDDAFSITDFFDTLMDNDEYHAQYYAYLSELVDDYVNGGAFDAFYERVRSQIDTLVEADPNAFYSYDEYTAACEMLYNTVKLRAESVSGQVGGSIPSTESAQRSSDTLVDASSIDISVMGTMNGGGGGFGGGQDDAFPAGGFDKAEFGEADSEAGGDTDTSFPPLPSNGGFTPGGDGLQTQGVSSATLISYGVSLGVLVLALILALVFRRRRA